MFLIRLGLCPLLSSECTRRALGTATLCLFLAVLLDFSMPVALHIPLAGLLLRLPV